MRTLVPILVAVYTVLVVPMVRGHGRLIEPPSRASAWRYGFQTPPNYNDHELYCGGFSRQWQRNGGQCGLCGDAWDMPTPRPHELGGTYGQGVIVRRYNPGAVVTIRVELTANHAGKFVFGICPKARNATQDCVDKHLLTLAKPQETDKYYYYPREGNKIYEMRYRLPADLLCSHCVLQWRYTAGNNWGQCANGTGAVGCGPQEEFRGCADISIGTGTPTDTNEIPQESTGSPDDVEGSTTQESPRDVDSKHQHVITLLTALVALVLVIIILAALYGYYYQVGKNVKIWLRKDKPVVSPVPPPRRNRTRNLSPTPQDRESLA